MTMRRGRGPNGPDEAASLSDDEVQRRLEGGAGVRVMQVRSRVTSSRQRIARDTGIILAGALVAIAVGQLLGGGDGGVPSDTGEVIPTEIVTRSQEPVDSRVAIASLPLPATIGPIVNPSLDVGASPTPVPFETLGPTTVTVFVKVRNDQGGNDTPSDWQVRISGAHPSVASFSGSADGRRVVIDALTSFTITTSPTTEGGYAQSRSGNCDGPVPGGLNATCTITEDDKPVRLTVSIAIQGGGPLNASEVKVKVTQAGSTRTFTGSKNGSTISLDSNRSWKTTTATPFDFYDRSFSADCTDDGVREGRAVSCTITFDYVPAPTPAFVPLLPLLPRRRRPA